MLLRAILCGGVWNGFLLVNAKMEDVPCRFRGTRDGDGHLFWECTFPPPFSMFGIFLSSLLSCPWIAATGFSCLLWHGWLPGLFDISDNDPWATSFGDLASSKLERCLGAYPVDFAGSWTPPGYWDADDIAL